MASISPRASKGLRSQAACAFPTMRYRQIRGKVDIAFDDLGLQTLKNIAEPMRALRMRVGGSSVRALQGDISAWSGQTLTLPDKPSIAVLPFQNMSGKLEQDYFTDGITEDMITALSKWRWFFVIARNSSFSYKGRHVDLKEVGRELGVRYVLEGSVRKAGSRVRVTAQLIDTATGTNIWSERYDRDLTDGFAIQDEVTQDVAAAIEPAVSKDRDRPGPTQDTGTAGRARPLFSWHVALSSVY